MKQHLLEDTCECGQIVNISDADMIGLIYKSPDEKNSFDINIGANINWNWIEKRFPNHPTPHTNKLNLSLTTNKEAIILKSNYDLFPLITCKYIKEITNSGFSSFGELTSDGKVIIKNNTEPIISQTKKGDYRFVEKITYKSLNDNLKKRLNNYSKSGEFNGNAFIPISESYMQILQSIYVFDIEPESTKFEYDLKESGIKDKISLDNITLSDIFSTALYDKTILEEVENDLHIIFKDNSIKLSFEMHEGYKFKIILERDAKKYNISGEGSGLKQIVFSLLRNELVPNNSTIFLNEPEIYTDVNKQHLMVEQLVQQTQRKNLQLVLSTHSEHIIYGLITLIKKGIIDIEDVSVYSFNLDPKKTTPTTQIKKINFRENGNLEEMPGFIEIANKEMKISLNPIKN